MQTFAMVLGALIIGLLALDAVFGVKQPAWYTKWDLGASLALMFLSGTLLGIAVSQRDYWLCLFDGVIFGAASARIAHAVRKLRDERERVAK